MVEHTYDYDELIKRAGGKFRFTALIKRRMRELQRGMAPLVEKEESFLATALEEYRREKVWLVLGEDAEKLREERAGERKAVKAPAAAPAKPAALPSPPEKPPEKPKK